MLTKRNFGITLIIIGFIIMFSGLFYLRTQNIFIIAGFVVAVLSCIFIGFAIVENERTKKISENFRIESSNFAKELQELPDGQLIERFNKNFAHYDLYQMISVYFEMALRFERTKVINKNQNDTVN